MPVLCKHYKNTVCLLGRQGGKPTQNYCINVCRKFEPSHPGVRRFARVERPKPRALFSLPIYEDTAKAAIKVRAICGCCEHRIAHVGSDGYMGLKGIVFKPFVACRIAKVCCNKLVSFFSKCPLEKWS